MILSPLEAHEILKRKHERKMKRIEAQYRWGCALIALITIACILA